MPRSNSMVRSLPYPTIEDGNFSFPDANYSAKPQLVDNSGSRVMLRHELNGAPLIERLIADGQAKFACLVSVPKTCYRKLHISDVCEQEIEWDLSVVGEQPILGPVVLFIGGNFSHKLTKSDGVASIWQKKTVEFPTGARLARGRYLRPMASIESLLSVNHKDGLPPGCIEVTVHTNYGFGFSVNAASDIFNFIQNPHGQIELRASILTHAVSECFHILASEYGATDSDDEEGQWEQFGSLRALSDWLDSKNLPHWSEDGFDATNVTTRLYPIPVPKISEGD